MIDLLIQINTGNEKMLVIQLGHYKSSNKLMESLQKLMEQAKEWGCGHSS